MAGRDGRDLVAREARRDGSERSVTIEPLPVERNVEPERVRNVSAGPAINGPGCLALLVLAVTAGTAIWLWFRHEVVFPPELRSSIGWQVYAEFYRDLSVAAVVLIGASWLWTLRSGGRLGAIQATVIVGVAAVFLAWLWTRVQFEPLARDRQVKELATWIVTLAVVALLWRVLKPKGRP